MCDCGCGFKNGGLGCLCLETKFEKYAEWMLGSYHALPDFVLEKIEQER